MKTLRKFINPTSKNLIRTFTLLSDKKFLCFKVQERYNVFEQYKNDTVPSTQAIYDSILKVLTLNLKNNGKSLRILFIYRQ